MKSDAKGLIASLSLLTGVIMFACAGKPPTNIGIRDGRLAPCSGTPNCVVSQGGDPQHHIDPIAYSIEKTDAIEIIKQIVQEMAGTRIVTEEANYVHVEYKSKIMGFVDDVEFYFPEASFIQVRSASRVGHSDLGVNRKRIEEIRQLFHTRLTEGGRP